MLTQCAFCGHSWQLPEDAGGSFVRCPNCGGFGCASSEEATRGGNVQTSPEMLPNWLKTTAVLVLGLAVGLMIPPLIWRGVHGGDGEARLAVTPEATTEPERTVEEMRAEESISVETAPEVAASHRLTLVEARRGFQTKLLREEADHEPVPVPPKAIFRLVHYPSPVGELAAYVSPNPLDGRKHPAILWIHGGASRTLGDCWSPEPPSNDQTAAAFRQAGIVMMVPSLRGGNDNPGVHEGFLGEVDDILAAADYLAQQDYVDPQQIYLGGHSTGGTLVLLVAEVSSRFRAVFSFGPVYDVACYTAKRIPFDTSDSREFLVRAPYRWLQDIASPVFVFEGAKGNLHSLRVLAGISKNPLVHCYAVPNADHFSLLDPVTHLLAVKMLGDAGPTATLAVSGQELTQVMAPPKPENHVKAVPPKAKPAHSPSAVSSPTSKHKKK